MATLSSLLLNVLGICTRPSFALPTALLCHLSRVSTLNLRGTRWRVNSDKSLCSNFF